MWVVIIVHAAWWSVEPIFLHHRILMCKAPSGMIPSVSLPPRWLFWTSPVTGRQNIHFSVKRSTRSDARSAPSLPKHGRGISISSFNVLVRRMMADYLSLLKRALKAAVSVELLFRHGAYEILWKYLPSAWHWLLSPAPAPTVVDNIMAGTALPMGTDKPYDSKVGILCRAEKCISPASFQCDSVGW